MKNLNVRSIDVAESFITDENVIIAAASSSSTGINLTQRDSGSVLVVDLSAMTNNSTFSIQVPTIEETNSLTKEVESANGFNCTIIFSKPPPALIANVIISDSQYKNAMAGQTSKGHFHYSDTNLKISALSGTPACAGVKFTTAADSNTVLAGMKFDIKCDGTFYYCFGHVPDSSTAGSATTNVVGVVSESIV